MQRPEAHPIRALDQVTDPKVDLLIQTREDRPVEVKAERDNDIESIDFLSAALDGITNRASLSAL